MKAILALLVCSAIAASGCAGSTDSSSSSSPAANPCSSVTRSSLTLLAANDTVITMATDKGCIVLDLFDHDAPITVANFRTYTSEHFFDGTLFHRIAKSFMIQGGGMGTDGKFKTATHAPIKDEGIQSGHRNLKFSIAMAMTNVPDSATNQFFINDADNCFLDPPTNSACPANAGNPQGYAVFGNVVQGRDVVEAIAGVPVTSYTAQGANTHCQPDQTPSCPKSDVVIKTVSILA